MKPTTSALLILLSAASLPACDFETDDAPAPTSLAARRDAVRAYRAGALGERLVEDAQLLVDADIPPDTDQVQYALLTGAIARTPRDIEDLQSSADMRGKLRRKVLVGGDDSASPVIFNDIDVGTYTVCVFAGPPVGPEQAAFLAHAGAAFERAGGGDLSAEKLMNAAAQARAETGYTHQQIDWSGRPARCSRVDVTKAAASRVAVLGRA